MHRALTITYLRSAALFTAVCFDLSEEARAFSTNTEKILLLHWQVLVDWILRVWPTVQFSSQRGDFGGRAILEEKDEVQLHRIDTLTKPTEHGGWQQ